jgi:hypothetical protein
MKIGEGGITMHSHARIGDPTIPRPPRLRPTWSTWMWIAFMVAVIVFSIIGFSGSALY